MEEVTILSSKWFHSEFAPMRQNFKVQSHGFEVRCACFVSLWPWMSYLHPLGLMSYNIGIRIHTTTGLMGGFDEMIYIKTSVRETGTFQFYQCQRDREK